MLRSNDIIGNPVITYDTGEQIGKIEDVVFDAVNLIALITDKKNSQALYMERVKTLGPDAVIVDSARAIVQSDAILERQTMTKGLRLMTGDAREIGFVHDVCFETDGRVSGYEISSGRMADVMEGRSFLPSHLVERIGKEVMLVSADADSAMEAHPSAVKAAVQTVGGVVQKATGTLTDTTGSLTEKIKGVSSTATEKIGGATGTLAEKIKGVSSTASEKITGATGTLTEKVKEVGNTATSRFQKVEVTGEESEADQMAQDAMEAASERTRQLYEAIEKKRAEMNDPSTGNA